MDRIEYKEGIIIQNGSRVSRDLENIILALSATSGKSVKETCDWLNQLLQFFGNAIARISEAVKELAEIFGAGVKDICESCKDRRTRHGSSSRAGKPRKAVANIKWQEKYRPP